MNDWLTRSFQEHSVLWLVISSLLGGVLGATIKFLFETFLPQHLTSRREILAVKRKYQTPILQAADELRRRLQNMILNIKLIETQTGWLRSNEVTDYYFLSTIYTVSRFFGWQQILRREVVYLDFTTINETKTFEGFMRMIREGFSTPDLLGSTDSSSPEESQDKWIFSFWIQGIGESMVVEGKDNCYALSYSMFLKKIAEPESANFDRWLNTLAQLFADLKSTDVKFQRLLAIHAFLNAYIDYADPNHLRTQNQNYHWNLLGAERSDVVRRKILSVNPNAILENA
ncbi:MAG TPA: hypothetical protein VGW32_09165 [Pyrinomonadaceae bacterium]|nr:hypothetical protein [Pyrinomonadaceae bacterium]